jgi:hypothetical protein
MRYACQYETPTGTIGLMIFTVEDDAAAQIYVTDMITKRGYTNVTQLSSLPSGAGIEELYRLFPRLAAVTKRGGIPTSRHR